MFEFKAEYTEDGDPVYHFMFDRGDKWRQMELTTDCLELDDSDDAWRAALKAFDVCRQVAQLETSTEAA